MDLQKDIGFTYTKVSPSSVPALLAYCNAMKSNAWDQVPSPLPLEESNFGVLREAGKIYVDKTEMIFELAKYRSKALLIRPKRFGKTLLVSTFFSLFKYGLRDFTGLAIDNLWKDKGKYSVVSLDLSKIVFEDFLDFKKLFNSYLLSYLQLNNSLSADLSRSANGLYEFERWLGSRPKNSLVLLIDNYDAPFLSCLNKTEALNKVGAFMSTFYSCIKDYSGVFSFLFLTGITKFGNPGIFPN